MPRWEDISDIDKFNQSYDIVESGCWMWNKGMEGAYGSFYSREQKKTIRASRFSYIINIGEIPEGLFVLHSCDTPACVNPEHLFLGTQSDNMQDMVSKGRWVIHSGTFSCGSSHRNSIVTEPQVIEMRELYSTGLVNQADLAAYYHLKIQTVSDIIRRASWRHI